MERKFNLCDEPWIRLRKPDETTVSVSLREALLHAQDYLELAGETAPQDSAVLRILEAIVHKTIQEFSPDGRKDMLEDADECLNRWEQIWKQGYLPAEPVLNYLDAHHDDFWLIDDQNPFLQVLSAKIGTRYEVSKLIGDISESSNKSRLFSSRSLEGKQSIDFAEAARWLISLNAYDDTSMKKKGTIEEKLSPGAGWLGKIGQIYASGQNLFETLMLNCVLVKSGNEVYPPDHLSWEDPQSRWKQRHHIPLPDNFGALMTLRSRLILLESKEDRVTGYRLLAGEFFDRENCFVEPFTVWKKTKPKKNGPETYSPKRHSNLRQLWRDFSSIILPCTDQAGNENLEPGIIRWLNLLMESGILPENYPLVLEAPYVTYRDVKDSAITDLSSQNLRIHSGLLKKDSQEWLTTIAAQIEKIDQTAFYAGLFFENLAEAKGASPAQISTERQKGSAELYSLFNLPFSDWISSITAESGESAEQKLSILQSWTDTAASIAEQFRKSVMKKNVQGLNSSALFGRVVTDDQGRQRYLVGLRADMIFDSQIRKVYPDASVFKTVEERSRV